MDLSPLFQGPSSLPPQFENKQLTGLEKAARYLGLFLGALSCAVFVGLVFLDNYARWYEELRTGEKKVSVQLSKNLSGNTTTKVENVARSLNEEASDQVQLNPENTEKATELAKQKKEAEAQTAANLAKQKKEAQEKALADVTREQEEQAAMSNEDTASKLRAEAERVRKEQAAMIKEDESSRIRLEAMEKRKEQEFTSGQLPLQTPEATETVASQPARTSPSHVSLQSKVEQPKEVNMWQRSFDEVVKLSTPAEERYEFTLGHLVSGSGMSKIVDLVDTFDGHLVSGSGMSKIVDLVDTFELEGHLNLQGLKHWEKLELFTELYGSSNNQAYYMREGILKNLLDDLNELYQQKSSQFENVLTYLFLYKDAAALNRNNSSVGKAYSHVKGVLEKNKNYKFFFEQIKGIALSQPDKLQQLQQRGKKQYRPEQLSNKAYLINQKRQKELVDQDKERVALQKAQQVQEDAKVGKAKIEEKRRQDLLVLPPQFKQGPSLDTKDGVLFFKSINPTLQELEAIARNPEQQNIKLLAARFCKLSESAKREILKVSPLYVQAYMYKHLCSVHTQKSLDNSLKSVLDDLKVYESSLGDFGRLKRLEAVEKLIENIAILTMRKEKFQGQAQNLEKMKAQLNKNFREIEDKELIQLLEAVKTIDGKKGGLEKINKDFKRSGVIKDPKDLSKKLDEALQSIKKEIIRLEQEIKKIQELVVRLDDDGKNEEKFLGDIVGAIENQTRIQDAVKMLGQEIEKSRQSMSSQERQRLDAYLES